MYDTDEQQSEALHKWVRKYFKLIIACLVILFGSYLGWEHWQQYRMTQAHKASIVFSHLITSIQNNASTKKIQPLIQSLETKYSNTPYADLAQLLKVKYSIDAGNTTQAIQTLKHIIAHSAQPALKDVARMRLVRIFLSTHRLKAAQKMLQQLEISQQSPLAWMLHGNLLSEQNKPQKAVKAYKNALKSLPENSKWRPLKQHITAKIAWTLRHIHSTQLG
jgi:predicted negative regulator of RcsB-dependent stress response